MRHAQSSVFERLGKALHVQFDSIAKEPLPERWGELIDYLNEREQAQRRAQHWSDRAEEARLRAADMTDPQARHQMLMIAAEYRRLAGHADRAAAKTPPRA
jgi:pyruvate-formate lyase